MAYSLEMLPKS